MNIQDAKSLKRNDPVMLRVKRGGKVILARVEDDLCSVSPEVPEAPASIQVLVRRVNSRGEAFGDRVHWPSALIEAG